MSKWYKIPTSRRVTEREYRANVSGMNIVFGAVLGVVLGGTEGLPPLDFMTVLVISAMAVIMILYLGSSEHKLFYGASVGLIIYFIPAFLTDQLTVNPIPYLQPTLAIWAIMVVALELLPREKGENIQTEEANP